MRFRKTPAKARWTRDITNAEAPPTRTRLPRLESRYLWCRPPPLGPPRILLDRYWWAGRLPVVDSASDPDGWGHDAGTGPAGSTTHATGRAGAGPTQHTHLSRLGNFAQLAVRGGGTHISSVAATGRTCRGRGRKPHGICGDAVNGIPQGQGERGRVRYLPQCRARGLTSRVSARRPARVAGWSGSSGCRTASQAITPPSIITVFVARSPH